MFLKDILRQIDKYSSSTLSFVGADIRNYTYVDLSTDIAHLSGLLVKAGFCRGQLIGMYAQNSYEWIVWDIATLSMGIKLFVIPSEIEINAADVVHYVEYNGLAALVTDRKIESKYVLPITSIGLTNSKKHEIDSVRLTNCKAKVVSDDSELTYVFSSGTTGELKGLIIDWSGTEISVSRFIEDFDITHLDSHVMYLPFSHFQQRMVIYGCLYQGVKLTFTGYTKILQTIESVKPSFLISPPALYENIANLCRIKEDIYLPKLKALSTHIRFAITGMAPIGIEIINFFQSNNIPLFEGYGVTEAGFIAWNKANSMRAGSVGKPILNILITEEGEIIVIDKNNLTKRYFTPNAEKDRKVFLNDGSVATGDIGKMDEQGFLYLRGRIKDIIITSGGKKFNPQEIENILIVIPEIKEIAIIDVRGAVYGFVYSQDALSDDEKKSIKNQIIDKLKFIERYKNINNFVFVRESFTPENGYRTRTFKVNRKAIKNDFIKGRLGLC